MTGVCRGFLATLAFCFALTLAPRVFAENVLVFAASSLKTALDEVAGLYEAKSGQEVTISYAASSALARQIQNGAPADLFISANPDWMDILEQEGSIDQKTRVDLLGNSLVLIGTAGQAPIELTPETDLLTQLGGGFLAMALVDAVPAGIYGKAALKNLELWESLQGRVAQTDNVRAALALVAVGAAPMGIVYHSDAVAENRVAVVAPIPTTAHPPIIYPAAVTSSGGRDAAAFLDFIQQKQSSDVFERQGFTLPGG